MRVSARYSMRTAQLANLSNSRNTGLSLFVLLFVLCYAPLTVKEEDENVLPES